MNCRTTTLIIAPTRKSLNKKSVSHFLKSLKPHSLVQQLFWFGIRFRNLFIPKVSPMIASHFHISRLSSVDNEWDNSYKRRSRASIWGVEFSERKKVGEESCLRRDTVKLVDTVFVHQFPESEKKRELEKKFKQK